MKFQSERGWLWLALATAALAGITALAISLYVPLAIQDDARQFLFWMAEWRDETLFRGDLVADYWRSVSPWLYVLVFRSADILGIDPITAARLLPVVLFPATAYFAFRFALAISEDDVRLAGLATLMMLIWLADEDAVVSATPRAFAPLFLMIFLDGLARRSLIKVTASLFCLAGIYPHVAIVAGTTLAIVFVDLSGRPKLVLSRANLILFAAGAVAALAGVAPLLVDSGHFGPIVTPETAKEFATFGPSGRSRMIGADGAIDFVCGERIGIFNSCDGFTSLGFWWKAIALLFAPVLVFVHYRRTRGQSGSPIPLAVMLASFAWFFVGIILAFELHIPSRFVVRTAFLVSLLCLGIVIGAFLRDLKLGSRMESFLRLGVAAIALVIFVGVIVTQMAPPGQFRRWERPALADAVRSYPPGTVFAGALMKDLDYIPLLAARRVLFSNEHAVAYHLGYYRRIEARIRDMAEAELTPDAAMLAERLERNEVDVYLIEAPRLADPYKNVFGRFLGGSAMEELKSRYGGATTALSRLAPSCSRGIFDQVMVIDAHCVIAAAR